MRTPSIHITEDQLSLVLQEVLDEYYDIALDTKLLAKLVGKRAKHLSIIHRSINISNDRVEKKTQRLVMSSRANADLFAKLLVTLRRHHKHRGVGLIKPGSKDWDIVKEVTGLAVEFCEEFELGLKEGFTAYINTCLKAMARFSLPKMVSMYERVCNLYGATLEISRDPHPKVTEAAIDYYTGIILKKTGIPSDHKKNPEKYACFVKLCSMATEFKVGYKVWIDAQFAGLSFANGVPDPLQMIGDKAVDRLTRYMFENNMSSADAAKDNISEELRNLKKLKRHG